MGRVRDVLRNKDFYLTRKGESKSTKQHFVVLPSFQNKEETKGVLMKMKHKTVQILKEQKKD